MKIKMIGNTVIGKGLTRPSNTYMTAVGSIVDIYPAPSPAPKVTIGGSFETDKECLAGDWKKVGDALRFAFDTYNSESI